MNVTVRRNPKQPTMDRTLSSRITEWASVTVLGVAIAIAGAALGLFDHPAVVAISVSVGNIIGQCARVIVNHRRKKKNGIAR